MNIILIKAFNKKPWRSPETYQIIESALKNKYKSVAVIIAENKMQLKSELSIYSGKSDVFIFNIAEYIEESDNSFIPDTLEELSLPHLGSSCETIRTGLNKAKAKKIFRDVEYYEDPYDTVKDADALIIVTEWNEFRNLDLKKIKELMKQPNIIDGRNIYEPEEMKKLGFNYIGIGR